MRTILVPAFAAMIVLVVGVPAVSAAEAPALEVVQIWA